MDRDEVEVHKLAKKERGQYPAILTSHLVNKGFIIWLLVKFCLRDTAGSPERARWLHLEPQRAIWFILPAHGASHIIRLDIGQVLFCVFMDLDSVSVHKHAKKERGQYAFLTEQTWSIKDLLYGFRGNFACGIQRVAPSNGSTLPARVANHSARSGSSSRSINTP